MNTIAPQQRNFTSFDLYKQGLSYSHEIRGVRSSPTSYSSHRKVEKKVKGFPRKFIIAALVAFSVLAVMLPATKAFGRRSLVSSERPSAVQKNQVVSVTVKSGDTLWSIARRLEPNRDPREIVDQLVQARGTANVYAGETIEWTR